MKPSFALNLSHDGLSLLRRAKGGWQVIGSVALDDTELPTKLKYLRKTATELAGGQLASKLVIPNSEILYRKVTAPGSTDKERAASVALAMAGATPYGIGDLAYDWVDAGDGMAYVAAVARDTLEEAENFASEHRFNPVSFVAIPGDGMFVGEPFFGETRLCQSLLPDGEQVEGDPGPIEIMRDHDPDTAPETPDLPADDAVTPGNGALAGPDTGATEPKDAEVVPPQAEPRDDDAMGSADTATSAEQDADRALRELEQHAAPEPGERHSADAPATAEDDADIAVLELSLQADAASETGAEAERTEQMDAAATPASGSPQDPGVDGGAEQAKDAPEPASAFSTSRTGPADPGADAAREPTRARFVLYADKARPGSDAARNPGAARRNGPSAPMSVTAPDIADVDLPDAAKKPAADPEPSKSRTAPKLAGAQMADKSDAAPPAPAPASSAASPFSTPDTGKPKFLGLTITVAVAALIVLVVLMSSLVFDQPFKTSRLLPDIGGARDLPSAGSLSVPQIVSATLDPATQQSPQPPAGDISTQGNPVDGMELAALSPEDQVGDTLFPPTGNELAEANLDEPLGEMTVQEATVIHATTGAWVLAPVPPVELEAEALDEFYIASVDRAIISLDAVALPTTANALNDVRPGDFASPAAAGTRFDLDARGFVRATSAGAVSADGVRIFLGRPSVVPRLRPASIQVSAPVQAAVAQLPRTRPTPRPANLIEQNERSRLGGLSRLELAAKRPVARPASRQDAAPDQTPTALAVLSSRAPLMRPGNFATTVAVTLAAAIQQEAETAAAVQETAVQAAAVVTPAPQRGPTIPTNASVARESTIENAINLSRVNLIGVYGSSSDRRALVRLKSGRYVKVQIGDRLDGGKVAVIDATKLQYIKAGRMVTLKIAS